MKVSECNCESERINRLENEIRALINSIGSQDNQITRLQSRIKVLERLFERQFAPDSAGHPNDGGWFD